MVVIWGLDLRDMQWGKFKSSYMFGNKDYHLRRTKFVVYQLAMIFCVVSESVGTAALSKYVDQQDAIKRLNTSATIHNDDFVGAAAYNIFVGVSVATIFGAAFFFDLFFPARWEPMNIRWAWRISAVVVTIMCLSDAITLTVVVAKGQAHIVADNKADLAAAQQVIGPASVYLHNPNACVSVGFLWAGWLGCIASTYVMFRFYQHVGQHGPMSHHAHWKRSVENGGR